MGLNWNNLFPNPFLYPLCPHYDHSNSKASFISTYHFEMWFFFWKEMKKEMRYSHPGMSPFERGWDFVSFLFPYEKNDEKKCSLKVNTRKSGNGLERLDRWVVYRCIKKKEKKRRPFRMFAKVKNDCSGLNLLDAGVIQPALEKLNFKQSENYICTIMYGMIINLFIFWDFRRNGFMMIQQNLYMFNPATMISF